MTPEHLASRVVVVDGQQGFVGETGTITTVEPDGTFTVADFVRDRVEPPKRTGHLAPEAVRRLARAVDAELAPRLPEKIGGAAAANPRRLRIRYGGSETALVLPAGPDPAADEAALLRGADEPAARVLRVSKLVRELVGGP